jgi:LacI family transcriptional regulator, repressor for deo operon, udp, cdd, tsx, nupC, and nupG
VTGLRSGAKRRRTSGQDAPAVAGRANIVDVARRAGVSVATVSRALRNMPNVSETTRDRVLRAAAELHYAASPLASGLVTGRVRAVGVVMPYAGRWFFAEVLRGIEEALRDHGYDLVLHVLADSGRRDDFFASLPVRRRVDAILVVALPLAEREVEVLRTLHVPLACVGEPVPGLHAELIDNVGAARLAVQHVVNLGHRRIACIGGDMRGPERFSVPGLRHQGYREALEEAGLPIHAEWERDGCFTARGGERAMTELLSQPGGRPTAVFCQSDEMAFGALRALRHSGLRCPDDVSVVGLDDHELSETFDMTTVAQPVLAQGAVAARWVVSRIEGSPGPGDASPSGTGAGTAGVEPDEAGAADPEPADGGLGTAEPVGPTPVGTKEAGTKETGPEEDVHPVRLVLRGSTGPVLDGPFAGREPSR